MLDYTNVFNDFKDLFVDFPNPYKRSKFISEFEDQLKKIFNVEEAIAVSSGTAALHCSLQVAGIKPNDEVLVPSLSVIMSLVPILYQNAKPVFVDCEIERIDFDYSDLEKKITPKTKAIIPVYLWGHSYNISKLLELAKKYNLTVIEDACQAHGTKWNNQLVGTFGDTGCFSMRDGKLLSTGEGGFILTNNKDLASKCRYLINHCTDIANPDKSFNKLGWNYRLSDLQAILGTYQLKNFNKILKQRVFQSKYLYDKLRSCERIVPYNFYENEEPNLFSPVFFINNSKNEISNELNKLGILNSVGTFGLKPAYQRGIFNNINIVNKNTEIFLQKVLALVLLPSYTEEKLDFISKNIIELINRK